MSVQVYKHVQLCMPVCLLLTLRKPGPSEPLKDPGVVSVCVVCVRARGGLFLFQEKMGPGGAQNAGKHIRHLFVEQEDQAPGVRNAESALVPVWLADPIRSAWILTQSA